MSIQSSAKFSLDSASASESLFAEQLSLLQEGREELFLFGYPFGRESFILAARVSGGLLGEFPKIFADGSDPFIELDKVHSVWHGIS
jgi:hypothetical protein